MSSKKKKNEGIWVLEDHKAMEEAFEEVEEIKKNNERLGEQLAKELELGAEIAPQSCCWR